MDETMRFSDGSDPGHLAVEVHPRTGIPASVPMSRRFTNNPAGAVALYLVQFIGPATAEWIGELEAAGLRLASRPAYNGAADPWVNRGLFAGTSDAAARAARLQSIQWLDYWHPFMRGTSVAPLHPRIWSRYSIRIAEPWRDEVLAELRTFGLVVQDEYDGFTIDIEGEDWPRLHGNRLLTELRAAFLPWMAATAWPHRARPGSFVTITPGVLDAAEVLFRGVPSPRIESRNGRLYAVVPRIPHGPADITVRTRAGVTQVLPHDVLNGFTVGEPESAGTLTKGDLLMLTAYTSPWDAGQATISAFDESGALLSTLLFSAGTTRAIANDANGFIVSRGGLRASAALERLPRTPGGRLMLVDGLVLDAAGNFFISSDEPLTKETPAGGVLASYPIRPGAFDLAADQCTLFYGQAGVVKRYDVCRNQPLADFATTGAVDIDILPDGGALIVSGGVHHYAPDGSLRKSTSLGSDVARKAAISADATFAWVFSPGKLHRYDLATRTITRTIDVTVYAAPANLSVYGGWTAARGFATHADAPTIATIDADGTIRGSNFVAGMTVTINGAAVPVQFLDANTLRIAPPPALSEVAVIKPNGQRVTWGSAHLGHDVPLDPRLLVAIALALAIAALVRLR